MANKYFKGRRFEWKVKEYFKSHGYVVIRSAASKPIDLVAMKEGIVLFIECKYNAPLTKFEKEQLLSLATQAGAIPILAVKKKGERGFSLLNLKSEKLAKH